MSFSKPRAFALVPARSGSKSVSNKNFRLLPDGRNLTSIAVALSVESGIFSEVILSSDSGVALDISDTYDCRFHNRPAWASSDEATASEVLESVSSFLHDVGVQSHDYVFYLQPTSPKRSASLLTDSWSRIQKERPEGLVTVAEASTNPFKNLVISEEGLLQSMHGDALATANRQSLPKTYIATGDLFAFKWGSFLDEGVFPISRCLPVIIDSYIDIDSEMDFAAASEQELLP